MRPRSLLLAAGACLASLTLTVGSAAADPPTPTPASTSTPEFGHPPCTATSSPSTGPVRSVPTSQPLHPVGTSSPTTPVVSTPTPTDTIPTATTTANCVTLFSTPAGLTAGPFMHVGPDGNFWFPNGFSGGGIVRMLSHAPYTQTVIPIPNPAGNVFGITTGPDGNIWFTELGQQFNKGPTGAPGIVGRILTRAPHTVTTFALPTGPGGIAKAYDIAAGGDGNLWFTRSDSTGGTNGTPEIDQILTQAPYTITRYPLPQAALPSTNAGPQIIIADHQGNLWFNYIGGLGLGEISPFTDQVQLFNVNCGAIALGPAQDPDSIWCLGNDSPTFAASGNFIGRVDTITHAVTKHPVTFTGTPTALGAGPDGNIWVTEARTGYAIGRLETHAPYTFSEIPLPDDTYSISPTCGPDGNEWFATNRFPNPPDNPQGNPGLIGRVNLTAHDGLAGLSDVIGSGLAGDLGSLLGGLGHGECPAPPPGIFPHGR